MALLARFACGCRLRVEIPAPPTVRCAQHGATARLIDTPRGQVRYVTDLLPGQPPAAPRHVADGRAPRA